MFLIFVSSLGLHALVSSEPYGLRMHLLAVSPFGSFGGFSQMLIISVLSVGLGDSLGVKLRHNVSVFLGGWLHMALM